MSDGWPGRLLGGWLRPGGGAGRPSGVDRTPAGQQPSIAASPAPPSLAGQVPSPSPAKKKGGVIAVTVLGLSGEALERVLELVVRECASTGMRPVFVTDGHELEPFRRRKLLVDQVVDAEARLSAAPGLPWRLYRRRQYALMGARWRPRSVVGFGRQPDEDCLAELRGG